MPRYNGSSGHYHSSRQKGLRNRKRRGTGTYSRENKAATAMSYLAVPPWFKKAGSR